MRTNFTSPVRMNLQVLPKMLERGSGTIVNVASGGGRFGIAHESMYCASKFALTGWSEVAAADLADTPIEVKLIQPGAIATEIWDQREGELPGLPGAEFVTAEVCAAGIVAALETDGLRVLRARGSGRDRRLEERRCRGLDRAHGRHRPIQAAARRLIDRPVGAASVTRTGGTCPPLGAWMPPLGI